MKQYQCTKSAVFAGTLYKIGEIVPENVIDKGRVNALIGFGLIAVVDVPDAPPVPNEQSSTDVPPEPTEKPKAKNGKKKAGEEETNDTESEVTE